MSKWVSIVTSALPEEVVSAVAVPEIVVSPWFPLRGGAAYDRTAVDEHLNGSHVTLEIVGVSVSLGQLRGSDLGIVLSRAGVRWPNHCISSHRFIPSLAL